MAYATPYVFTALELLTAAKMNAIQDNITALWVGTTAGDQDYYVSATAKQHVAIGTAGQIWMSNGSAPGWVSGERYIPLYLNSDVALTTGDYQGWFPVPSGLNGWNVTSVLSMRSGGTGVPSFQLRRIRSGASADVLSTQSTIDSGEVTSVTAATPAVINTANDDLATGDILSADVDGAGTSTLRAVLVVGVTKP